MSVFHGNGTFYGKQDGKKFPEKFLLLAIGNERCYNIPQTEGTEIMPMPKVGKDESRDDYISRFMSDKVMEKEYPDRKQRLAVAYSQYRKHSAKKNTTVNEAVFGTISLNMEGNGNVRYTVIDNREYIVGPVKMINEGVHHGSMGRIYYPADELKGSVESWNHKPVMKFHPEVEGMPVNSCSAEALEAQRIGFLLNTVFNEEDMFLDAELYVDTEKAMKVAPDILNKVKKGEMIEVSTGLYTDNIEEKGKFGDEEFDSISFNFRPDHLALLPGKTGACSIGDGAGFPRNEKGEQMKFNELSHDEKRQYISKVYRKNHPDGGYIMDVYDNWFTVEVYSGNGYSIKKYGYSVDGEGKVTVSGDGEEVERYVQYKPAINNQRKEPVMADRKEKIDALIGNPLLQWNEDDRDALEKLDEGIFNRLGIVEEKLSEKVEAEVSAKTENMKKEMEELRKGKDPVPPVGNQAPAVPKTIEEAVAAIPEQFRGIVVNGINKVKEEKAKLIANLKSYAECKFSTEALEAKGIEELQILNAMIPGKTDFSIQGGKSPTSNLSVTPLPNPNAEDSK